MKALIIVDIQNDFCPGGSLPVENGDTIIKGINRIAQHFNNVITTQDWHPQNHGSFASNHKGSQPFDIGLLSGKNQILWPDHCVQGSIGAQFHKDLDVLGKNFVKGTNPRADSYSGFFDDDGASTGLHQYLQSMKIKKVYICGLATDYCVKFTALDALKQGYNTLVLKDLCRGVNIEPGDADKALEEMHSAGGSIVYSNNLDS